MNKETTEMNALQVQLPPDISVEEARLLLMVKLFETGRLSLGQAAKLAGYSKPTFIELLGKMGVPVIDYPAEDLQQEINL
jgi:predicted HTH domain antitoxin